MIRPHAEFKRDHPRPGWTYRVLSPEETVRVQHLDAVRRNAHRQPASEYTRILLRAKEGDISPGHADTLIHKLGGRVRIRPIPRPPS